MLRRYRAHLRIGFAAAALGAAAALAGLDASTGGTPARAAGIPPAAAALPDSLAFEVSHGGIGAEGVDLVWHGAVAGPTPGQLTIRMEYAGQPGDRRMPVWPVNAWLLFSADDLRSSFAAELSGSMNWRTGEMRVTGLVSDGIGAGTPVEQRMRVRPPGLAGHTTVRFFSEVASRGANPATSKRRP